MTLMTAIVVSASGVLVAVILSILLATPRRRGDVQPHEPRLAEYDDYATGWQDGYRDCQVDYDVYRLECQADRDKRDAEYWHGYNTGWMVAMQNRERKS